MENIESRSILITGGGSGIGAAAARHFAGLGALVTIADFRLDAVEETARNIGQNCVGVRGDVTSAEDRQVMIDAAIQHGGGLHAVIHSAGNLYRGNIEELNEERLLSIFHVNVIGAIMLTGLAIPHIGPGGSILFIGSTHTRRIFPGASPYLATKAAINALTRSYAAELGPKEIRVNCVLPGSVPTQIVERAGIKEFATTADRARAAIPLQTIEHAGTADDVAEALEFLMRAPWITGALLDVDGGMGLGQTRTMTA